MLTGIQNQAVDMLFELSQEETAMKLGIGEDQIEEWKSNPEFSGRLSRKLTENRATARRILSRTCVDACRELEALIKSDDSKDKPRAIIEVLKASGLFKELSMEETDEIGGLIGRLADENEDTESGGEG